MTSMQMRYLSNHQIHLPKLMKTQETKVVVKLTTFQLDNYLLYIVIVEGPFPGHYILYVRNVL